MMIYVYDKASDTRAISAQRLLIQSLFGSLVFVQTGSSHLSPPTGSSNEPDIEVDTLKL